MDDGNRGFSRISIIASRGLNRMKAQYFKCQSVDPELVVKKAFYLAWIACEKTEGMGELQDQPDATEDEVWAQICTFGDHPGRAEIDGGTEYLLGEYHADYVFGRRLKLLLFVAGDTIKCLDYPPEVFISDLPAYSETYPTAQSLIEHSGALIGAKIECVGDES